MTIITAISNEKGPCVPPIFEELLFSSLILYERKKKRWEKGSNSFQMIPKLAKVKVLGEKLLTLIQPFPNGISFLRDPATHSLQNMLLHLDDDPHWTDQMESFLKRYRLIEKPIRKFLFLALKSLKSLIPKRQRLKMIVIENQTKKPAVLRRALYRDERKVLFEYEEELERGQIVTFEKLYLLKGEYYLVEELPWIDSMPIHIEDKAHQWQWLLDFLHQEFKDFSLVYR